MIKYICDFCKKEIDGKETKMMCDCTKIMPRIGTCRSEFALHFHEDCVRSLIGECAIMERNEKCEKEKMAAEERRKEREAKMKGGESNA